METNTKEVKYSIQGMDCADCALSLERSLAQIKGVEQVNVNYTTGFLEANGSFDPQDLIKRVEALGYKIAEPGQPSNLDQLVQVLKFNPPSSFPVSWDIFMPRRRPAWRFLALSCYYYQCR